MRDPGSGRTSHELRIIATDHNEDLHPAGPLVRSHLRCSGKDALAAFDGRHCARIAGRRHRRSIPLEMLPGYSPRQRILGDNGHRPSLPDRPMLDQDVPQRDPGAKSTSIPRTPFPPWATRGWIFPTQLPIIATSTFLAHDGRRRERSLSTQVARLLTQAGQVRSSSL